MFLSRNKLGSFRRNVYEPLPPFGKSLGEVVCHSAHAKDYLIIGIRCQGEAISLERFEVHFPDSQAAAKRLH